MECSICLEDIEFKFKKTLQCEHMFHKKCIDNCYICPICRNPINLDDDIENLLKYVNINEFSNNHKLSIEFLKKYNKSIDITKYVQLNYKTDRNLIQMFKNTVNWNILSKMIEFTNDELFEFSAYLDWQQITRKIELSKENIHLFYKYLDWKYVSIKVLFTKNELNIYRDWLNWNYITENTKFTKSELWKFRKFLDWNYISIDIQFSQDELWKFKSYIIWSTYRYINNEQKLDKDIINYLIDNKLNYVYN